MTAKNKNFTVVDPKNRVKVYGTGVGLAKDVLYEVGVQVAEKLVASGKASFKRDVEPAKQAKAPAI